MQGAKDVGPGFGAVGFDVDEEVEGLAGVGVEDAISSRGVIVDEVAFGVLFAEDAEDGLDVQGVKGSVGG